MKPQRKGDWNCLTEFFKWFQKLCKSFDSICEIFFDRLSWEKKMEFETLMWHFALQGNFVNYPKKFQMSFDLKTMSKSLFFLKKPCQKDIQEILSSRFMNSSRELRNLFHEQRAPAAREKKAILVFTQIQGKASSHFPPNKPTSSRTFRKYSFNLDTQNWKKIGPIIRVKIRSGQSIFHRDFCG